MNPESTQNCLPEDKPPPRPEDCIGKIIEQNHRIEAVEAIGSKYVVFRLRNLTTDNIDQVLKIPRITFDPRGPLLEALPQAMQDLAHDPNRAIRICDRLLALDPANEAAAFDKGVALLAKKEPAAALEAFNLALSIAPADIMNLIHRGACLASLHRDDESLRDLQVAADLNKIQLTKSLAFVSVHALTIGQALTRLATNSRNRYIARQLLRAHFDRALRARLFLARFFH